MEQHEAKTRRTVVTSLSTAFHVLGLLLTFLVGIVAYLTGIFYTFALWLILASVPILVMVRLWGLFRKQLAWHFIRRPLQRESRRYLLQGLNRWTFWLLWSSLFISLSPASCSLRQNCYRYLPYCGDASAF